MESTLYCCDEFGKGQEIGTDNEGYGRLIHLNSDKSFSIGCELAPIKFCPWCGADKTGDKQWNQN